MNRAVLSAGAATIAIVSALAGAWVGARTGDVTTAQAVAGAVADLEARVTAAREEGRAMAVRDWRAQADAQRAAELERQATATARALDTLTMALDRRVALNSRTLEAIADAARTTPECPERPMLAALAATVGHDTGGLPDADRTTPASPGDP